MDDQFLVNPERCSVSVLDEAMAGIRESGRWSLEQSSELERIVWHRSRELGGYIRQLVRLVRLGALCSKTSYLEFFCRGAGNADAFHRLVSRAPLPPGLILVENDRVRFLEHRLATSDGKPFELTFRQMPRLAALSDVMHYTLGYEALFNGDAARKSIASEEARGLLWPMIAEVHGQSADECARRLHSVFGRWLSLALGGSAYEARQFETMASYLQKRDAMRPERIDNELLLDFWRDQAFNSEQTDSLGFRQYPSAVRALLRFRRALVLERSERTQVAIGSKANEVDLNRFNVEPIESLEWVSPLYALGSPPCNNVKWLTKREQRYLRNYLPAKPDCSQQPTDADPEAPSGNALMGPDRFNLQLVETLLRVDVFGVTQGLILSSIRRKQDASDALQSALAQVDSHSYDRTRKEYLGIRSAVVEAAYAALYVLGSRGDESAIDLLEYLGGKDIVECLAGALRDVIVEQTEERIATLRSEVIDRMRSAFRDLDPISVPVKSLVRNAKNAASKIKREGFRAEQQLMPGVADAYAHAAPFLVSLLRELDRLDAALDRLPLADMIGRDREVFKSVFEQLYLS